MEAFTLNSVHLRLELAEAYKDVGALRSDEFNEIIILALIYIIDKLEEIDSSIGD